MVLSCGGGIGWKIYRCVTKTRRRKSNPPSTPAIPYPNNIYLNPLADHSTVILTHAVFH